jgi:hypothetical protein
MKRTATILILLLSAFISNAQSTIATTKKHAFSSPTQLDIFTLSFNGKSILKSTITFKIITSTNKEIYKEVFPSTDLLGDMEDMLTDNQKIDTIKNRIKHFFDDENFYKPAIEANAQYDEDETDKQTWVDIKRDKTAIGFFYSHGYESSYGIAWSKRKKKVVQYFYSD